MAKVKCGVCGGKLVKMANFCGFCGTKTARGETVYPSAIAAVPTYLRSASAKPAAAYKPPILPAQRRPAGFRRFLIPLAAAILVVLLAAVIASAARPPKYAMAKGEIEIQNVDDGVVIVPTGKNPVAVSGYFTSETPGGGTYGDWPATFSMDGTKAAVLINGDGTTGANPGGYVLYYVGGNVREIAKNVCAARISANGGSIVYVKNFDSASNTAELYIYSGGKSRLITSDYSAALNMGRFAISPDGKTVAYTLSAAGAAYYWDGRQHALGTGMDPFAIADGAKYVYYQDDDGSVYVQKGADAGSKEKLIDVSDLRNSSAASSDFFFNRDLSQILYLSGATTYISLNGGPGEPLTGAVSDMLLPPGTAEVSVNFSIYVSPAVIGCADFADMFYITDTGNIIRIGKDYTPATVARNTVSPEIANDGATIVYLKGDSIYRVNGLKSDPAEVEPFNGDLREFFLTSGGNAVFFMDSGGGLYYQKFGGKPNMAASDCYCINGLFKGNRLYYTTGDKELYWTTGGKGRAAGGFGGDFFSADAGPLGVWVVTKGDSGYVFYKSTDGSKFAPLGTSTVTWFNRAHMPASLSHSDIAQ